MADNYTPVATGAAANANVVNAPIDELDDVIGSTALPTTAQTLTGAIAELHTQVEAGNSYQQVGLTVDVSGAWTPATWEALAEMHLHLDAGTWLLLGALTVSMQDTTLVRGAAIYNADTVAKLAGGVFWPSERLSEEATEVTIAIAPVVTVLAAPAAVEMRFYSGDETDQVMALADGTIGATRLVAVRLS